jgi:hypothetical protein
MTPRTYINIAAIGIFAFVLAACTATYFMGRSHGYVDGYQQGYRQERRDSASMARSDRADAVRAERQQCQVRLAEARNFYEGMHDHASAVWVENTRALIEDMHAYERDLEGCHHIRREAP